MIPGLEHHSSSSVCPWLAQALHYITCHLADAFIQTKRLTPYQNIAWAVQTMSSWELIWTGQPATSRFFQRRKTSAIVFRKQRKTLSHQHETLTYFWSLQKPKGPSAGANAIKRESDWTQTCSWTSNPGAKTQIGWGCFSLFYSLQRCYIRLLCVDRNCQQHEWCKFVQLITWSTATIRPGLTPDSGKPIYNGISQLWPRATAQYYGYGTGLEIKGFGINCHCNDTFSKALNMNYLRPLIVEI